MTGGGNCVLETGFFQKADTTPHQCDREIIRGRRTMRKTTAILMIGIAGFLGGCENMSPGQKGAVAGGALGTGIGLATGGSFGAVVGAGLIGGAVGYLGGTAIENSKD
jgi:hypothetical protein